MALAWFPDLVSGHGRLVPLVPMRQRLIAVAEHARRDLERDAGALGVGRRLGPGVLEPEVGEPDRFPPLAPLVFERVGRTCSSLQSRKREGRPGKPGAPGAAD